MTFSENDLGYAFIHTAGHGFLVVPKGGKAEQVALFVQQSDECGYLGEHVIYLEEDCQAPKFIKMMNNRL